MIEHVVLIKWKAETPADEREGILQQAILLKEQILGIISFHAGHNISSRSLGFDAALLGVFVDRDSLAAYGPHPDHQRLATRLTAAAEQLLVVDFEPLE